jgi:hypothetical protein
MSNTTNKDPYVEDVFGKLGVESGHWVRDLFLPGIRGGFQDKGKSTDEAVEFFRPHWEARRHKDAPWR